MFCAPAGRAPQGSAATVNTATNPTMSRLTFIYLPPELDGARDAHRSYFWAGRSASQWGHQADKHELLGAPLSGSRLRRILVLRSWRCSTRLRPPLRTPVRLRGVPQEVAGPDGFPEHLGKDRIVSRDGFDR